MIMQDEFKDPFLLLYLGEEICNCLKVEISYIHPTK